jgi:hypothetical protein
VHIEQLAGIKASAVEGAFEMRDERGHANILV